jgi:hypothetical protein
MPSVSEKAQNLISHRGRSIARGMTSPAGKPRCILTALHAAALNSDRGARLSTPDNPVPKYAAELIRCARMYSGA